MKKILLFLFIIPFLTSGQQFVDQIKGIYWTGTEEKFVWDIFCDYLDKIN